MSHGGDASEAEADLTPLLDLVLQLLMFFIINVNFVTEQVNPDIKLPTSESARPIDKADLSSLVLNQKSMKSRVRQQADAGRPGSAAQSRFGCPHPGQAADDAAGMQGLVEGPDRGRGRTPPW